MKDQVISTTPVNDPFEKAKAKSKEKMLSQSPVVAETASAIMQDKLGGNSAQDYSNFLQTELPLALQKLGIPHQGISLNEIGKINLMNRMQNKLGAGFMQHPEALKVLGMFNKALPQQDEEMKQLQSMGERTLGYLLGGG